MKKSEKDRNQFVSDLLESLVAYAFYHNASDIHLEPFEEHTRVRVRIDGILEEYVTLRRSLHCQLLTRIKIMADMDIVKRRSVQSGHFQILVDQKRLFVRVSVMPTIYGEKAVLRLLAENKQIENRETFGMSKEVYQTVSEMMDGNGGLIYLTGPTGSGKTTTLYLMMKALSERPVNICTIEDPVEQNLDGISQIQVNPAAGLTFETGLTALLRQDPDILMIGETRDMETASASVRAAITGHLVLSTLHTNDALSAIVRLKDMGVEPYLIAGSLKGVIAQRLVRKLCVHCSREVEISDEERIRLGIPVSRIRSAVGCPYCNGSGYSGRIAVHEAVRIDKTMRTMIAKGEDMANIRAYAREVCGMKTLQENGAVLAANGIISAEELRKAFCDE